jgi:hypothetical protein
MNVHSMYLLDEYNKHGYGVGVMSRCYMYQART